MTTEKKYQQGLLGRKIGMTQIFTEEGKCIPVTAIEVGPCYVLQVKTAEKDGYSAVQLGFSPKKQNRASKAEIGHFKRSGKGAFQFVREIRCDAEGLGWNEDGKEVVAGDVFSEGDFVDITGVSKGRGFAGVVKRFGVSGQPASRGTHEKFRNIGSVGAGTYPGRIWKNQKMPGQMGNKKVTTQNIKVVGVRPEDNVLLVRGGIPGPRQGMVEIRLAQKKASQAQAA